MRISWVVILLLFFVKGILFAQAPINTPDNIGGGNALDFDGVNDYVDVPSSTTFDFGTNSFTVEAWINSSNSTDYQGIIYRTNGCGSNTGWGIQLQGTTGRPVIYLGSTALSATQSVADGNWHHIAMVRNAGVLTLYIDGVQNAQRTDVITQNATAQYSPNLCVGCGNANPAPCPNPIGIPFDGRIDEVRVWNTPLTETQLKASMCDNLTGSETGLVGYWNMNEGTGNTVTDLTTNANHGTRL